MAKFPRPALFAGDDKVGLFKSLKNLRGSELRYAIGYNMSTLRMFGVPLAGIVSLPYDIQQTINTVKRVTSSVKSGSLRPTQQRATTLGFAKQVIPKARGLVPKTNFGLIDRYANVYFGRQTAEAIRKINRGEGRKAAFKALWDPKVVDREIRKQAIMPRKDNILHSWQMGTYMRAASGAPDPIRNNPFVQAKQFHDKHKAPIRKLDARHGIVDSKGQHLAMSNERFEEVMGKFMGDSLFNPEPAARNAVNNMMMDHMESVVSTSDYAGLFATKSWTSANSDKRRALLRSYYNKQGVDTMDGLGYQYDLSGSRAPGMYGLVETRPDGQTLQGYSNHTLRDKTDRVFLRDGMVNMDMMMDDQARGTRGGLQLHKDATVALADPEFHKLVTTLNMNLGLAPPGSGSNPEQSMMGLVTALKNVGTEGTLTGSNLEGTTNRVANQMRIESLAVMNFIKDANRIGYTSIAQGVANLTINQDLVGNLTPGKQATRMIKYLNNPGEESAIKLFGAAARRGRKGEIGNSTELIEGAVLRQRRKVHESLARYRRAGGGLITDKSVLGGGVPLNQFFLSPDTPNNAVDVLTYALEQDDGTYRYYKSHASLRYAENKKNYGKLVKDYRGEFKYDGIDYEIIELMKAEDAAKHSQGLTALGRENPHWTTIRDRREKLEKKRAKMLRTGEYYQQDVRPGYWDSYRKHIKDKEKGLKGFRTLSAIDEVNSGNFWNTAALQYKATKDRPASWQHPLRGSFMYDKSQNPLDRQFIAPTEERERVKARRKSMESSSGNNYIPTKSDIVESIHIIDMNSPSARGKDYMLKAAVVVGQSRPKTNIPADKVRDIAAIEYGGPATDAQGGLRHRTDGMYYLPSFFFTRACGETAAYLGLTGGAQWKSWERKLGQEVQIKIKDSPDVSRLKAKERKKHLEGKELKQGLKHMAIAQAGFMKAQRMRARKKQGENFRLANRRALAAFDDGDYIVDSKGNLEIEKSDRYIDIENLLQKDMSPDRFLSRTVAGHSNREWNMKALGRINKHVGLAGLGKGGYVKGSTGDWSEIKPRSFTDVWSVDGQSIVGRQPYIPVFDQDIYNELVSRGAMMEAKNYLKSAQRNVSWNKFKGEYVLDQKAGVDYLGASLEGALNNQQQVKALTQIMGKNSIDVRTGILNAVGLNDVAFVDLQSNVSNNPRIKAFFQLFDPGKTALQVNLATAYRNIMTEKFHDIMQSMDKADALILAGEMSNFANSVAQKVAGGIKTSMARNMVGSWIGNPEGILNQIERISIMLETGMSFVGDRAEILRQMHRFANRNSKAHIAQTLLAQETKMKIFSTTSIRNMRLEDMLSDADSIVTFTDSIDDEFNLIRNIADPAKQRERARKLASEMGISTEEVLNTATEFDSNHAAQTLGEKYNVSISSETFVPGIERERALARANFRASTTHDYADWLEERVFRLSFQDGAYWNHYKQWLKEEGPGVVDITDVGAINAQSKAKAVSQNLPDLTMPNYSELTSKKVGDLIKLVDRGIKSGNSFQHLSYVKPDKFVAKFYSSDYQNLLKDPFTGFTWGKDAIAKKNVVTRRDGVSKISGVTDAQMEVIIGSILKKAGSHQRQKQFLEAFLKQGSQSNDPTKKWFAEWMVSTSGGVVDLNKYLLGKNYKYRDDALESMLKYFKDRVR